MKNYALFSVNGRFIGFTNFKPTTGLYKEMPETFDPVTNVYVGDYETGSLKGINELEVKDYREANIDKKWRVFESELDNTAGKIITEEMYYPLHRQLNIIMDVLYKNKGTIQLTEEFEDMYNKIQEVRTNISSSFESYKEAPKAVVISKDDERGFFEEYNQMHLSINDELPKIVRVDTTEE